MDVSILVPKDDENVLVGPSFRGPAEGRDRPVAGVLSEAAAERPLHGPDLIGGSTFVEDLELTWRRLDGLTELDKGCHGVDGPSDGKLSDLRVSDPSIDVR